MSRNNRIYTQQLTTADITTATISDLWDFLEEGFTGLSDVTFTRDTENNVMNIYLDVDKKIYIAVKVAASGSGVLLEYYLDSEKCTYVSTATKTYTLIGYIRTAYGIAWTIKEGTTAQTIGYADFDCYYTQKSNPAMFLSVNAPTTSVSTYYVISPLHESVEPISENYGYLSTSLDNKKFWVTNAACFDETLNLRHLFRVIGCPSSGYLKGAIEVDTKKLFWFGRYALEYEKEE